MDYLELRNSFLSELHSVSNTVELQALRSKYTGKKGVVTQKLKEMSAAPKEQRAALGKAVNEIKDFIETQVKEKETALSKKDTRSYVDLTLPGAYIKPGGRHPVKIILNEIIDIFVSMGFAVEDGPEVETDYYNFEALNIPQNHPARDMQDTFYIKPLGHTAATSSLESNVVLRTHTSPVQIRVMEKKKPPLMFIAPGKVYRCDSDTSHTPIFHQVEGLMVDEGITFANLKAVLEAFLHIVFGPDVPVRFRPSFFPFTEPSAEVDLCCFACKGSGCRVCKNSGWIEILGAGMVDPRVFNKAGIDTEVYSGFAFGLGIERIASLRYGIDDIRLFYEGDLRFLRQF
ncbi:MAG: phenylalanine--tRNA ligase subunit alpha [Nitrospirae bacterium]|nr:phenylalanine--tRNA ligase subunit alpha [Nitrospirota bacterium]MBF0534300.1 phenylalanine--tRNA ligase subunit alpha [Nitrospirota bacterium]MBF0615719.1 phenylalanine--tRNA ligase subunit alpha [Nitrospirota bacterium]